MPFTKGKKLTAREVQLMLQRAGLELPEEDVQRLQPLFEQFREPLDLLRSFNLEPEEPASTFSPR